MTASPELRRHLDLEGACNIRDIGGYPTDDGRRTRWKMFLRSDSLHHLAPKSQAALIAYGVRTVIDLRRTEETETHPNVFVGSSEVVYLHHNIIGDGATITQVISHLAAQRAEGDEALELREREFVETELPAERIKNSYTTLLDLRQSGVYHVLSALADPAARPALYHCAGGKDRTGVITALLLGIAGVRRETIAEDYALTARFLFPCFPGLKLQRTLGGEAAAEQDCVTTWEQYQAEFCPPEGMIKTLQHLDDRYGGIEGYLQAIGLSSGQIESLRRALVE